LNRPEEVTKVISGCGFRPSRFLGFTVGTLSAFLDAHVLKLAGLEDFAALEAFHELRVFFTAHDLHPRMLARLLACVLRMGERL
jgi:hypothetical protein